MSHTNEASLVQLHIAEYQALTTRASYWIVLQFGLLPVVPIYLTLAAQVWESGAIVKEAVIWGTVAGLQLLGLVWTQTLIEMYAAVSYIELYLRPLVKSIVDTDRVFWGYELYLIKNRPAPALWGDLGIPSLILIVLVTTFLIRLRVISRWDICGVIVNLILLSLISLSVWKMRKMRREWSAFDVKLAEKLEKTHRTGMKSTE
ncbi:MAG: hypothetical protein WBP93_19790 [Pyrinomonadaceae bacterium]